MHAMFRRIVMLTALLALTGCEGLVRMSMIEAPNYNAPYLEPAPSNPDMLDMLGVDEEFFVGVDGPTQFVRCLRINPPPADRDAGDADTVRPPLGTLVVLHGKDVNSLFIVDKGVAFADAGYRVFLLDLAGHGRSGGRYVTFGVRESRDVQQVIDHLYTHGLVSGPLGIWGISLGASTAIETAAIEPRIQAVVAVAPFASAREEVASMVRTYLPTWPEAYDSAKVQQVIEDAAAEAGFDPDDADAVAAIRRTRAQVLIIGAEWDMICPVEQSRRIHEAAPDHSRFIEMPATGHVGAAMDLSSQAQTASIDWFDEHLSD